MAAKASTGPTFAPTGGIASSRSHTGRVLTDAERRQRKAAAEASARRRRAQASGSTSSSTGRRGGTDATYGLGDEHAAGYVNADRARTAFQANGVSGADIRQTKDASGFLVFAGKDQASHQAFVTSLKQMGFNVSVSGADGSGIAINSAGQAIRLGPTGNAFNAHPAPLRKFKQTR